MIHGETMGVDNIISKMSSSPFDFYLTGSRFFGINSSDWDFFATNDHDVVSFLQDLGFELLNDGKHYPSDDFDQELVQVYRHKECLIDVQLVLSARTKKEIQDFIAPVLADLYKRPNSDRKKAVRDVWRAAYWVYKGYSKKFLKYL